MKILNIFVDESGDFGIEKGSILYTVALTLHDTKIDIKKEVNSLENRFKKINYNGMVHTANLVKKAKEYSKYDIKTRKLIFNIFYEFMRRVNVKYKPIVIDKRYCSNSSVLKKHIINELNNMLTNNIKYFNKFDKIIIYYDNGQKSLTKTLKKYLKDLI